jgi:DNA-binding transcriptional LysR family regulator
MQWEDRIGRRLKPRDLHVFLAVVETGNMAKAADRLAISRPVVSKTIADLEHVLGVRLLDRSAKGVEPTLYGRALLRRSLSVFDELKQSVKEIEHLANPSAGEIRIGCTETISAGLIAVAVDQLVRRHPRWVFHMQLANAAVHLELLRSRICEVVVGRPELSDQMQDVDTEPLFYEKLLVVVGPHSRWHGRRKVALSDLVDEPWIQAPLEAEPGGPAFEAFRAARLRLPRATIFSDSLNLRYNLLETGSFITMIPESTWRLGPKRTSLKVLPIDMPRWNQATSISVLKGRTLNPMTEAFIGAVRNASRMTTDSGARYRGEPARTRRAS